MEIAQSDAAAAFDWYRSETYKAYERPQSEVTGNKSDDYERRAPGTAGMSDGVRYQIYESSDGHVLFMASRAGVLEELLRGRRPRRPVRDAGPARSTPTTPSATSSCATSCERSSAPHDAPSGSTFGDEVNTPIAPREHAARRSPTTRSSRTGSVAPHGRARRRAAAHAASSSWAASCRAPTMAPDGRPAHRRGARRGARLRRGPHRRAPRAAASSAEPTGRPGRSRAIDRTTRAHDGDGAVTLRRWRNSRAAVDAVSGAAGNLVVRR